MPLPTCCEINDFTPNDVQKKIYCQGADANLLLESINTAVGGGIATDQYASTFLNATADGTIPAGVLGWSIATVSGTVTVQTQALPVGGRASGGGYGGKTTSVAIPYTITAGVALVSYDTPV